MRHVLRFLPVSCSSLPASFSSLPARCSAALPAIASFVAILGVAVGGLTAPASAQSGHLGVYFDSSAQVVFKDISTFAPFQLYVIADFQQSRAPMGAEIWSWGALLEVDPRVTVTARILHPSSAMNFGGGSDIFVVGLGAAQSTSGPPLVLVTYECIVLDAEVFDARVDILDDATMIEFAGIGPAWASSSDGDEEQYGFESWSGALVNPREGLQSWGEMKSPFSGSN